MIEKLITSELSLKRWRRFKRNRLSVVAIWLLVLMSLISLTAEFWANSKPLYLRYQGHTYFPFAQDYHPEKFGRHDIMVMDYRSLTLDEGDQVIWPPVRWDPLERNSELNTVPAEPSAKNIMGTDDRGRDVLARLLYGYRYSMGYAVSVWFLCSFFGIILGAIMGFLGGWVDLLGQRVIEVIESLPWLLILITIVSIFAPDLWLLVAFSTLVGWVNVSLYIRGEFLKLRKREFVEAARALGASRWRQIFVHILPNSLTPWITITPFMISGSVAGLASLDFLGLGLRPPTPSWGELLSQAKENFTTAWWLAVYPSLALFVTMVLLNLIGAGVRDAFDPRKA